MRMNSIEHKLKERVKELKCLNELSRIAWDTNNDVKAVFTKVVTIIPRAMQYPEHAQVCINVDSKEFASVKFKKVKHKISSPLVVDKIRRGVIQVGYPNTIQIVGRSPFLPEEKRLIATVARELAIVLKRSSMEEDSNNLKLQLQHVERLALVGELSAGIAHELNEPLGRILGFAQLIKKEGQMTPQQSEDIERIIKASLYAREIIKKLMLFARQMPQQIARVNVNEVIENILYFIDVGYQKSGIQIRKKLDADLPNVMADSVQISQVIVNLITNAIQAMPNGGQLLITTRKKGKNVGLIVRDSGHGMPPEVRRKIFEPFFTTKPVGRGTGLGLSVVQGIVLAHRGTIAVRSKPGEGSTFEILLPIGNAKGKRL